MSGLNSSDLARGMERLAAEHRAARAPASVERTVLAEFDVARRRRLGWGIGTAAAVAASVAAIAVAGAVLVRERPAPHPAVAVRSTAATIAVPGKPIAERRRRRRTAAPRTANAEQPFIAIPYTVPLAPEDNVTVVRMTISPSAMAVAGFPLPAIDPGSATQADVLVGEDGRARAIRIVAGSGFR